MGEGLAATLASYGDGKGNTTTHAYGGDKIGRKKPETVTKGKITPIGIRG